MNPVYTFGVIFEVARQLFWLVGWIFLCLCAGLIGATVSGPDAWYVGLSKPAWTPPSWMFAPVWTTLYVLMGIAAWQVWNRRSTTAVTLPIGIFLVQLVLNAAWSLIFFGLHRPDLAFFELIFLWLTIVTTCVLFYRVCRTAGLLLIPYLCWTTYAAALNGAIWLLNRS